MPPAPSRKETMRLYSDYHVEWMPGYLYLPAMKFTGMSVTAINEGGAANDAYGVGWEGSHTGSPTSKEISTFGLNGILMNTDGQMVHTDFMIPPDLDPKYHVYLRVVWSCGSTDTADTVLWKSLYRAIIPESTALAVPDTAFNTILVTDTVPAATAYTVNYTAAAVINGGTLDGRAKHMVLHIEMDTKDTDMAEDLFLLGAEIQYTPKRLRGVDGMKHEAKASTQFLSRTF
jgi:hypothetical protein